MNLADSSNLQMVALDTILKEIQDLPGSDLSPVLSNISALQNSLSQHFASQRQSLQEELMKSTAETTDAVKSEIGNLSNTVQQAVVNVMGASVANDPYTSLYHAIRSAWLHRKDNTETDVPEVD